MGRQYHGALLWQAGWPSPPSFLRPGQEQPGEQGHRREQRERPAERGVAEGEADEADARPFAELPGIRPEDVGDGERGDESAEDGFAERHFRPAFRGGFRPAA